jgi:Tol biopolymer transport system component
MTKLAQQLPPRRRNPLKIGCLLLILLSCISGLLYQFVMYQRYYKPVPTTYTLPDKENLVLFTGSRVTSFYTWEHTLFILDLDNGAVWKWAWLLDEITIAVDKTWSPQSELLFFVGYVSGESETNVYTLAPDGTMNKTSLIAPGYGYSWSPDGTQMVFSHWDWEGSSRQKHEIYMQNADGSGLRRLTHMQASNSHPDWSPNGEEIVFHSYNSRDQSFTIYKINQHGTGLIPLTTQFGGNNQRPKWSPDGARIAFLHAEDVDKPYGLWIMDANGSNLKPRIYTHRYR